MEPNVLIQLISTLGFPIVCCVALFWRMIKSEEAHKEEMTKMSEALNNNTLALTKLMDAIGGIKSEIDN